MNIKVINKIDFSKAKSLIESDEFWKYAAHEWWRLYWDYVPHDTDSLRNKVKIRPKEIEHYMPYARFIYRGVLFVDPKFHVGGFTNNGGIDWFSRRGVKKEETKRSLRMRNGTRLWDEKAKQEKKDLLLAQSMQKWIDRNL